MERVAGLLGFARNVIAGVGAEPLPSLRLHGCMTRYCLRSHQDQAATHDFNMLGVSRVILAGIERALRVMDDSRCRFVERPGSVVGVVRGKSRSLESPGR